MKLTDERIRIISNLRHAFDISVSSLLLKLVQNTFWGIYARGREWREVLWWLPWVTARLWFTSWLVLVIHVFCTPSKDTTYNAKTVLCNEATRSAFLLSFADSWCGYQPIVLIRLNRICQTDHLLHALRHWIFVTCEFYISTLYYFLWFRTPVITKYL